MTQTPDPLPAMAPLIETAFAKINLALHVTGQRGDGYHLLDTLVTFADSGDRLTFAEAEVDSFSLSGAYADSLLSDPDPGGNLVLKARDALRDWMRAEGRAAPPVQIHLEKNLPVASGIGGGSADAAAVLRGLCRLWHVAPPKGVLQALSVPLGADVPMCLVSRPLIARGIGEKITRITLPPLFMLLANPLVPVSTPQIFRLLTEKNNPAMPAGLDDLTEATLHRLMPLRNDLQPPAEALEPAITRLLAEIADTGARVSRMSGSGATCFGLYDSAAALEKARAALQKRHPGWFLLATRSRA